MKIIFATAFLLIHCSLASDELNELIEEWKQNAEIADKWNRPIANSEFKDFSDEVIDYGTYDFVVVGAGSSGAIIASRLSEIKKWKVMLIEAGGDEADFGKIPGAQYANLLSQRNWGYLTVPQDNACLGFENNQCDFSAGKVLGGSSSINAMMYVRGNEKDFEKWGSEQWTFDKVLPYFLKLENATNILGNSTLRGSSGPVKITYPNPDPNLSKDVLRAYEELGDSVVEYNGAKQLGVSLVQRNIHKGLRQSTNVAYLENIKDRPNLTILKKSLATKIVTKNNQATELQLLRNGKNGRVGIAKELILSAGAINSPQLLMLSGIGPANELSHNNITLVKELPVGRNLEDHVIFLGLQFSTNISVTTKLPVEYLKEYLEGFGEYTYSTADVLRFKSLNLCNNDSPDLEYIIQTTRFSNPLWLCKSYNCKIFMHSPKIQQHVTIQVIVFLLHPRSIGTIALSSADPTEFPKIDPRFLEHSDDREIIYQGIKDTLKLLKTRAFKKLGTKLIKPNIAECNRMKNQKRFWMCAIKYLTTGIHHPLATCKMGYNDKTSVVNDKLFVHGFKNLRVADGSIIPKSPSGHTNGIAMMIGEKISDEIKSLHLSK